VETRVAGDWVELLECGLAASATPPVVPDLSIAFAAEVTAEELGDRVRQSLTAETLDAVEEVAVVDQTPGSELPARAIARIGLQPGQKNVLVRLALRHPTWTLTAEEANRIRDHVYAAIHEGQAHQWASP
jgi:phenylalanyl-tRNA synthetase alpha chain